MEDGKSFAAKNAEGAEEEGWRILVRLTGVGAG
jgi:hypothetical protein